MHRIYTQVYWRYDFLRETQFMLVFFVGRAHSPMLCHLWPTLACLSLKSTKEKSRQLWRRSRHVWRLLRYFLFSVLGKQYGCVIQTRFILLFWQEQRLKELSKRPSFGTTDTSPVSTTAASISTAPAIDLFSTPSCSNGLVNQVVSYVFISGFRDITQQHSHWFYFPSSAH